MTSPTTVPVPIIRTDVTRWMDLGHIDQRCAISGEHPVDVLEGLLLARDTRSQLFASDPFEIVA
jgi:hypothetical protein